MYSNKTVLSFVLILFFISTSFAGDKNGGDKNKNLERTNVSGHYLHFNINKISTPIYNNGISDLSPTGNSGLVYPKGSGKTAVYVSGLVWGASVNGELRVGGSAYITGLQPGRIISNGIAANPDNPSNRVYRVRPDYKSADLTSEINDGEGTAEQIRKQYEKDWNEWPANEGAPYNDLNGDGKYEPSVDIPGVPAADQTLWFVSNDLDTSKTKNLYGSLSMGLEVQVTVWGYNRPGSSVMGHIMFKKYKIINKGNLDLTKMYTGYWSDVDDGNAGDDLDGCDTLLNLGYTYNSGATDATYDPLPPPAIGFTFLQGPVVPGDVNDKAIFDGKIIPGMKNLNMTSIGYIFKQDDARQGVYKGTIDMYNFLQGKLADSSYIPVPQQFGGGYSVFPFSGDPAIGSGWLDGVDYPPADRRIMINSGQFNMAPGDTQEVVIGEIISGAEPGYTNLSAVTLLKFYTKMIQISYAGSDPFIGVPEMPDVNASEYNQSVVFNWGTNQNKIKSIEDKTGGGYGFEGYNVYQLPTDSSSLSEGLKIATFDRIDNVTNILDYKTDPQSGRLLQFVAQSGSDSGVKRFIKIDYDYLRKTKLRNGSKYFYAVTAYTYNPNVDIVPRSYESLFDLITVIPRTASPGNRLGADFGTVLSASHTTGNSNGKVEPVVIDPINLNGHKYKITFISTVSDTTWNLMDLNTGNMLFEGWTNQDGKDNYPVTGGLLVKVMNDKNEPNTPADEFVFTAPANSYSENAAKSDVEKVNVFPNPYYGYNANEETKYGKFVTFSHLPQKATIRIFDLAGRLIRTMEKDSPDQFYKFYLFTNANTPLGSGIYIAFIEMPELRTTKVLKFAVITPQIVPDHF